MRFEERKSHRADGLGLAPGTKGLDPLRAFDAVAQQFSARIRYFLIFIERGEQP